VRRDFILTGLFVDPRNGEFEFIGEFLGGEQFGGLAVCVGFFDRLFDCGLDRVENRLAKNGLRVIVAQLTASRVTL